MPNKKEHLKVGTAVGGTAAAGTYVADYFKTCHLSQQQGLEQPKFNWLECILITVAGSCLGGVGGILPDLLEPAVHSYHRKTMHSVTTGVGLSIVVLKNHSKMTPIQRALINAITAGYGSHLVMDSKTPRNIPFI